MRLLGELRAIDTDFRKQAVKGRRPSARAVGLALQVLEDLVAGYPAHVDTIAARTPWLWRRRSAAA